MNTMNFPAKIFARQQSALERLTKSLSSASKENKERINIEISNIKNKFFVGNPKNIRSKKDRSSRAKI